MVEEKKEQNVVEEQKELNVKAFTKTMEELQEICMQLLVEKFQRMDRMLPVKK